MNRGCLAISKGGYGGARTEVVDDGITRAPCIAMPDIHLAFELLQVKSHFCAYALMYCTVLSYTVPTQQRSLRLGVQVGSIGEHVCGVYSN